MAASSSSSEKHTNRLANETSPYLLQHAHNPVDWYAWGPEAFERARAEDRPIFLSVGYSACHWCHVMERESFENAATADLMNQHFINVKVDREERPDVDQVYMAAVQAMTGQGGWPMSVFLTPDLRPFFGGTYFPPADRMNQAGFPRVLQAVAAAWSERRAEIQTGAAQLTERLGDLGATAPDSAPLNGELLDNAFRKLSQIFDPHEGGFGDAPKFPHPMDIQVLLRHFARTSDVRALAMARLTLDKMARGGIYDHLGGGFARYSTDARWLVPHFEKMLYDNALLARTYVEAFQVTGDSGYAGVARGILDYLLTRMTDGKGGLYATEDADSEGEEGRYYVWTQPEVLSLLGAERGERFCQIYDVTEYGNWEHRSILNLARPLSQTASEMGLEPAALEAELRADRAVLLAAREKRVPPGKDTKILTAWNGLAISALALAGRVLAEPRYLQAARAAAAFVLDHLRDPDGRLLHVFKDGRAAVPAFLDDHACLVEALTRLFEATGEARWLDAARELARHMIERFQDSDDGGFYFTADDQEKLIVRGKDATDNATPAGNAVAATALLRLAVLTDSAKLEQSAMRALQSARTVIARYPSAAGQSLIALDFALGRRREVVICEGADPAEFQTALNRAFGPFRPADVFAPRLAGESTTLPLFEGRGAIEGAVTTFVCENHACKAPATGLDGLSAALGIEA